MKKLELQNFGVLELDAKELRETDGGGPITWLFEVIAGELAVPVLKLAYKSHTKTTSNLGVYAIDAGMMYN